MKNKVTYSREHLAYLKKQRQKKIIIAASRWLVLLVLLGLWELCAYLEWADPYITSSPSRVCLTIADLYKKNTLFYHIGITLMETVVGFIIAVAVGYVIAIALWSSESLRKIAEPYIVVLNSLPKIALGPLIIIWIGIGYDAIIFMTVIVSVIVCIMNMLAGFISVDKTKMLLMKSMGAGKLTTLRKLIIPSSLPALISTLKVAVGLAWIGSIMGEYIASEAGLGSLINYGGQVMNLDLVMASTFILCVLAGGMYAIIALVEKKVVKHE
ncbi:MAG: ABC transporter permease [Muribaculaceae bacterium]|nr:ABC transporter permease [Muribaculaceae bacterium]